MIQSELAMWLRQEFEACGDRPSGTCPGCSACNDDPLSIELRRYAITLAGCIDALAQLENEARRLAGQAACDADKTEWYYTAKTIGEGAAAALTQAATLRPPASTG